LLEKTPISEWQGDSHFSRQSQRGEAVDLQKHV